MKFVLLILYRLFLINRKCAMLGVNMDIVIGRFGGDFVGVLVRQFVYRGGNFVP